MSLSENILPDYRSEILESIQQQSLFKIPVSDQERLVSYLERKGFTLWQKNSDNIWYIPPAYLSNQVMKTARDGYFLLNISYWNQEIPLLRVYFSTATWVEKDYNQSEISELILVLEHLKPLLENANFFLKGKLSLLKNNDLRCWDSFINQIKTSAKIKLIIDDIILYLEKITATLIRTKQEVSYLLEPSLSQHGIQGEVTPVLEIFGKPTKNRYYLKRIFDGKNESPQRKNQFEENTQLIQALGLGEGPFTDIFTKRDFNIQRAAKGIDFKVIHQVLRYEIDHSNMSDIQFIIDRLKNPYFIKLVLISALERLNIFHQNNFVHRDIKLEHLFIDLDENFQPVVDIIDFDSMQRISEIQDFTLGGAISQMPPEQCLYYSIVHPRMDLFALGAVFYRLMTGKIAYGDFIFNRIENNKKLKDYLIKILQQEKCEITKHTINEIGFRQLKQVCGYRLIEPQDLDPKMKIYWENYLKSSIYPTLLRDKNYQLSSKDLNLTSIPDELQPVLTKMLSLNPTTRYQNVAEVLKDIN